MLKTGFYGENPGSQPEAPVELPVMTKARYLALPD
jgi:hypothetical protein